MCLGPFKIMLSSFHREQSMKIKFFITIFLYNAMSRMLSFITNHDEHCLLQGFLFFFLLASKAMSNYLKIGLYSLCTVKTVQQCFICIFILVGKHLFIVQQIICVLTRLFLVSTVTVLYICVI